MIPLPSLSDSAAWLGAGVLAIALVVFGRWTKPGPNTVTAPDTVTVEEPMAPGDILDATTPTQVTGYDTSETRTECMEVPTWLSALPTSNTTTSSETAPKSSADTSGRSWEWTPRQKSAPSSALSDGPPYAITPMTTGRPSLSVGSSGVTLSGYLPDGRGRQWTYDIPQETWAIAPSVTAEATPSGPVASTALTVTRKSLSLSAGYEVATDYHGWRLGLTWTPYRLKW